MVGDKIKYTCKNCGWWTAIRAEWGDLKPKRCMNKKCNTSFQKTPDALITQRPEPQAEAKLEAALKKTEELPDSNFGKEEASLAELPKPVSRRGKRNESQDG